MKIEDIIRKIRILRRITPENGASEPEADTAARLARLLMERFSIASEDVRATLSPAGRLSWVYWERLLSEFGIRLDRFGRRGSASIGRGTLLLIRLDNGQWSIRDTSPGSCKVVARDWGLDSLRGYLVSNGPRSYSLTG
jgi:hypothetical protein